MIRVFRMLPIQKKLIWLSEKFFSGYFLALKYFKHFAPFEPWLETNAIQFQNK